MTDTNAQETALAATPVGPTIDRGVLGTQDVLARVTRILEIQNAVMKSGVHYGIIPGTQRPTLYKAGAEKLLMTFRIAHRPGSVEELRDGDEIRFRVLVEGVSQTSGELLGAAYGECSSSEEKYRWRKPVCDEEWDETPEDRRRAVWKKYEGKPYKAKQVRTSPADVANTILQMATKRGLVQMTRVVLACSDIFEQDLEDMPDELRESLVEDRSEAKPPIQAPQRKANGEKKPAAIPVDSKVSAPLTVKDVVKHEKQGKKTYFELRTVEGQSLTTFDDKLALELIGFKGTTTKIVARYLEKVSGDRTFYNLVSFTAAEAAGPVLVTKDVGQDEIPW